MFTRNDRIREVLKTELSLALRLVKDPGLLGFLTVTDLKLSIDRKTANVYYSILGSETDKKSTARALERIAPFIRQLMRKRLTLKSIPQFIFAYDETPQKASRVDKLLDQLRQEKP